MGAKLQAWGIQHKSISPLGDLICTLQQGNIPGVDKGTKTVHVEGVRQQNCMMDEWGYIDENVFLEPQLAAHSVLLAVRYAINIQRQASLLKYRK